MKKVSLLAGATPCSPLHAYGVPTPPPVLAKGQKAFYFSKMEAYKAKAKQERILLPPLSN